MPGVPTVSIRGKMRLPIQLKPGFRPVACNIDRVQRDGDTDGRGCQWRAGSGACGAIPRLNGWTFYNSTIIGMPI